MIFVNSAQNICCDPFEPSRRDSSDEGSQNMVLGEIRKIIIKYSLLSFTALAKDKAGMGSAFHQLCPRYSGTLTPTAPTAIRLWETFTFTLLSRALGSQDRCMNDWGVYSPLYSISVIQASKRWVRLWRE